MSDSGASNSELSAGSSSGDNEKTPSPIYKNQQQIPQTSTQPSKSSPSSASEAPPQRKPPAYGRQFSAPHLQQQKSVPQSMYPSQAHCQLLHSKSESSPLAQIRAFQPTRPKVPPKPLDLAPQRAPLSKTDRQDFTRRSLDAGRIRRMVGPAQGNPPLSRAFSERISSTSDALSRYHAARMANQAAQAAQPPMQQQQQGQSPLVRPVLPSSEDPSKMENFYYEIGAPENRQGPPSYSQHSYQNMKLDVEGNYRLSDPANQRPLSRGHPPPQYSQVPGSTRSPPLWSSEATRAWAAAHSHSFSFSHTHSHSHHSQDHPPGHRNPRVQRQTSSSVKLVRSEVHPIPAASCLSSSAGLVPLSVHQRNLHCQQRSPSSDLTASQLHPYFENGKVCYRYFEASRPEEVSLSHHQTSASKSPQSQSSQASPLQAHKPPSKEQSEPIYVNYPFASPPGAGANSKTWATTNLDGEAHQETEALAPPPEPPPEDEQQSPHQITDLDSPCFEGSAQNEDTSDSRALEMPAESSMAHVRSRSDPQTSSSEPSQALTGKDIASLLIEKLAEDEREGPNVATSSSASSSPHIDYPPNPYPSQHQHRPPPAYNVYTPGPSRSHFEAHGPLREGSGAFHRQDPLRRSSGSQYRQAFDVMPSGDQVLKFYRSQDFIPGPHGDFTAPNPYPTQPLYQDPSYLGRSPQAHQDMPRTSSSPSAAFSNLALSTPRAYGAQTAVNPYSQHPFQAGPVLPHYPGAPRRDVILDPTVQPAALRSQRGLNRQGSLPGPNWTIHTEGQTRSYC